MRAGPIVAGGGYTLTNNASDICGGSGGTPGGNNSDVQFNNAGNFGETVNSPTRASEARGNGAWPWPLSPAMSTAILKDGALPSVLIAWRLELVQAVVSAGGGVEDDVLFSAYSRLNSAGQNMFALAATGTMNNAGRR